MGARIVNYAPKFLRNGGFLPIHSNLKLSDNNFFFDRLKFRGGGTTPLCDRKLESALSESAFCIRYVIT